MQIPDNTIEIILWLLGGLGLFLYGIELMGKSLQKAAGNSLRSGLSWLTKTRFHGLFTGAGVTALLQSSSASTVMVVGFINAGLMSFRQSVSLILGTNIGSTITPQITAFRGVDAYSLPLIGIGFLLYFFTRRRVLRRFGTAIMGFGMLFFGLWIMKETVQSYHTTINEWFRLYAHGGLKSQVLAFLVATAATCIIQSSAATVAMLQTLAVSGVIPDVGIAIPMILGAHVGTCITAVLASLGASLSAKRAAAAHVVFNVLGVFITVCLFQVYTTYIPRTSPDIARQIANCHTIIKLVNVLLMLPFCNLYGRIIEHILPGKDKLNAAPMFLDFRQLDQPAGALENAAKEIQRISGMCIEMLHDAVSAFRSDDEVTQRLVLQREDIVDELVKATGNYIIRASRKELPPELSNRPVTLFYILNDAERIGDHAENIVELAQSRLNGETDFTEYAAAEIRELQELTDEMGRRVITTLETPTIENVRRVFEMKTQIDAAYDATIEGHATRLAEGVCSVVAGIVYLELLTDIRRVANHLRNMAMAAAGHIPKRAIEAQRLAASDLVSEGDADTPEEPV